MILLFLAVVAMALAIYGGLVRLGLAVPPLVSLEDVHGPLMVCGVFGTLISLERAVAIGAGWPYAAPACFAFSAVTMVAGSIDLAAVSAVAGAATFLAASTWIATQQRALFTSMLALAAFMLLVGCALWLGGFSVPSVVAWWLGFLVLTIAAERLELSRVRRPTRLAQLLFFGAVVPVAVGAVFGIEWGLGGRALGAGFLGIVAWLARHDVATRTVRLGGQPRFMAVAMLGGYFWLGATGLVLILGLPGPLVYDAVLHAALIGFVLSMVLGHALIIFPAVTGIALRYWPPLYLPLGLLHLSVVLRVIGDLAEILPLQTASGPVTALALVSFGILVAAGRKVVRPR